MKGVTDYSHRATLGLTIAAAFDVVAPRYGLHLAGIEDDANEHSVFWQEVAKEMLQSSPPRMPPAPQTPTP